jgi:2-oxoglutarate/2-oxoacid ferredoxin oxidoreductase subunit alpha
MKLPEIEPVQRSKPEIECAYQPYKAGDDLVAPFLNVNNNEHQVRLNASMHNHDGRIVKNEESLAVSKRLARKINTRASELAEFDYLKDEGATKLIVSYGISALAAHDAVIELRSQGQKVSLLVIKTLIPLAREIYEIIDGYDEVLFAEENINGQLQEMIYGKRHRNNIKKVNKFGSMVAPSEIVNELV